MPGIRPQNLNDVFQVAASQFRQKLPELSHSRKVRASLYHVRVAISCSFGYSFSISLSLSLSLTHSSAVTRVRSLAYIVMRSRILLAGLSIEIFSMKALLNFAPGSITMSVSVQPPLSGC
jgi:hypothetical protein